MGEGVGVGMAGADITGQMPCKNVWHFGKLQKLQLPFTAGKGKGRARAARSERATDGSAVKSNNKNRLQCLR